MIYCNYKKKRFTFFKLRILLSIISSIAKMNFKKKKGIIQFSIS